MFEATVYVWTVNQVSQHQNPGGYGKGVLREPTKTDLFGNGGHFRSCYTQLLKLVQGGSPQGNRPYN